MANKRIGFGARPKLSASASARAWIAQFRAADQQAAADLLDSLILLNEADVALAVRHQLRKLASGRTGKRKKAALYVEREFAEHAIFKSELKAGRDGQLHWRAVGARGPAAVSPRRGSTRVGSEGPGAFLLSQASEIAPSIFLNGPGPDRIRRHHVSTIVIVTDFIGTGARVRQMLDKFMRVPSVRAWRSAKWIDFAVVAAATTVDGKAAVEAHRAQPAVYVTHVAPTLQTYRDQALAEHWEMLARNYGPPASRGAGPLGFRGLGALVAFTYRAPNNLPVFLHAGNRSWRPLFQGAITEDMALAFGWQSAKMRTAAASVVLSRPLAAQLTPNEGQLALVLSVLRGPWRPGQEVEFAERTGLTVPEILEARAYAISHGLLTARGRLTDAGHAHILTLTAAPHPPAIPHQRETILS